MAVGTTLTARRKYKVVLRNGGASDDTQGVYSRNRLGPLLKDIVKTDLQIIDECKYLQIDIVSVRLLCQVMLATYEPKSMIVTTNIRSGKCGTILGNAHLTSTTVDKIKYHGRLVEFSGRVGSLKKTL
ncbi:ATP-binding protein [Lancefieldella rimae]|uniref:ATP-binding protein n=1 Tax=Lancefieldella rimae TaxID=1383 RepID=UPI0009D6BB77